jgi:hypothetical protein
MRRQRLETFMAAVVQCENLAKTTRSVDASVSGVCEIKQMEIESFLLILVTNVNNVRPCNGTSSTIFLRIMSTLSLKPNYSPNRQPEVLALNSMYVLSILFLLTS